MSVPPNKSQRLNSLTHVEGFSVTNKLIQALIKWDGKKVTKGRARNLQNNVLKPLVIKVLGSAAVAFAAIADTFIHLGLAVGKGVALVATLPARPFKCVKLPKDLKVSSPFVHLANTLRSVVYVATIPLVMLFNPSQAEALTRLSNNQTLNALQSQVADLQVRLDAANKIINNLDKSAVQDEHAIEQPALADTSNTEIINQLKAEIDSLNIMINVLKAEIDHLTAENAKVNQDTKAKSDDIAGEQTQITVLKDEIASLKNKLTSLKGLNNNNSELQAKIDELSMQLDAYKSKESKDQATIKAQHDMLSILGPRAQELSTKVQKLSRKVKVQEDKISELSTPKQKEQQQPAASSSDEKRATSSDASNVRNTSNPIDSIDLPYARPSFAPASQKTQLPPLPSVPEEDEKSPYIVSVGVQLPPPITASFLATFNKPSSEELLTKSQQFDKTFEESLVLFSEQDKELNDNEKKETKEQIADISNLLKQIESYKKNNRAPVNSAAIDLQLKVNTPVNKLKKFAETNPIAFGKLRRHIGEVRDFLKDALKEDEKVNISSLDESSIEQPLLKSTIQDVKLGEKEALQFRLDFLTAILKETEDQHIAIQTAREQNNKIQDEIRKSEAEAQIQAEKARKEEKKKEQLKSLDIEPNYKEHQGINILRELESLSRWSVVREYINSDNIKYVKNDITLEEFLEEVKNLKNEIEQASDYQESDKFKFIKTVIGYINDRGYMRKYYLVR